MADKKSTADGGQWTKDVVIVPDPPRPLGVYDAISAVQGELARVGISKDRKNQAQGFTFRGIDDVFNALSPLLAKYGLCMLPRFLRREMSERQSTKGGVLFSVVVEAEFDLVARDGSKHTVRTYGEAMDSADKATNKAMSAAYKYAALQAFGIPTEGDNDADATTHEVAPAGPAETVRAAALAAGIRSKDVFTTVTGLASASDVTPDNYERVMDALKRYKGDKHGA